MEKGLAILGKMHDGAVGSFTGPELIRLAGHFPAGFTHIEEHLNTLEYLDHQRILTGRDSFRLKDYMTPETDRPEDGAVATIDPPPSADSISDSTTYVERFASRYYRLREVRQQAVMTIKEVGRKALSIHRTIRGTNKKKDEA